MTEPKGTIFIIDDDMSLQAMLSMALSDAGYQVVSAYDGEDALEKMTTISPSLIISDLMMPNMDGVEMFYRLKERLQNGGIPIIIITALNYKPWFADLEAEGAAIFQKPFEIEQLIEMVQLFLS